MLKLSEANNYASLLTKIALALGCALVYLFAFKLNSALSIG